MPLFYLKSSSPRHRAAELTGLCLAYSLAAAVLSLTPIRAHAPEISPTHAWFLQLLAGGVALNLICSCCLLVVTVC